jgi:hypothetical protein
MKVVCIRSVNSSLIVGKTYVVNFSLLYLYNINDESGWSENYPISYFIKLEEFRNNKIEEILG